MGNGSFWIEPTLALSLSLGVVEVSEASFRVTFNPVPGGGVDADFSLRGLTAKVDIPAALRGEGSLKIEDGGVIKASLDITVVPLQVRAMAALAIGSPIAGPRRRHHMASTTLIVDDAFMATGTAHAWRRGLVFDSAITASLFDERLVGGRPQEIVNARRQLLGALLGIGSNFVPETAAGLIAAAKRQNTGGGFGRLKPGAFPAAADTTSAADREIWNPSPRRTHDWVAAIAGLSGDELTEFENGTR